MTKKKKLEKIGKQIGDRFGRAIQRLEDKDSEDICETCKCLDCQCY